MRALAIVLVLATGCAGRGKTQPGASTAALDSARAVPEVTGALDTDEAARVLRGGSAPVYACYTRLLEQNNAAQGRVVFWMLVTPAGEVTRVVIRQTTLRDPETEACMAEGLRQLRFPSGRRGLVQVVFPFELAPPAKAK